MKYTAENRKTCLNIQQEVGPELPTPQPDLGSPPGPYTSAKDCVFKAADQAVLFAVRSWENTDDVTGAKSGNDRAKKYFTDRTEGWDRDSSTNVGSEARWRETRASACALEALDENAVLTVALTGGAEGEQCRATVRDLAKRFYAAMQP
ncbi:hypothetical protein JNUCC0626_34255 [Lentzea sp. JNUCC 0626]|uniref:hypothetical protein n=1 Tax=Lentzea sp. JNUCC 0626 TaxID=3367513 RepID=UPI00374A2562